MYDIADRSKNILPQTCGAHVGECGGNLLLTGPDCNGNRRGGLVCSCQGSGLCCAQQSWLNVGHGPHQGVSGELLFTTMICF